AARSHQIASPGPRNPSTPKQQPERISQHPPARPCDPTRDLDLRSAASPRQTQYHRPAAPKASPSPNRTSTRSVRRSVRQPAQAQEDNAPSQALPLPAPASNAPSTNQSARALAVLRAQASAA